MLYFFGTWVILSLYVVRLRLAYSSEEVLFDRHADSYLDGFVIRAKRTNTEVECGIYCTSEPSCVSANFKVVSSIAKYWKTVSWDENSKY